MRKLILFEKKLILMIGKKITSREIVSHEIIFVSKIRFLKLKKSLSIERCSVF